MTGEALPGPVRHEERFRAMGTEIHLLVLGGDPGALARAQALIADFESRWSRFLPTSELGRLNHAEGQPIQVSADTFSLIMAAVDAWGETGGVFDPTITGALERAGYDRSFEFLADPRSDAVSPGPAGRASDGQAAPGCGSIVLDPVGGSISLPAHVSLDLGGLGKGWAADLIADRLQIEGVDGWCVNLGGDLRVGGQAPDEFGWGIHLDHPGAPDDLQVQLQHGAVATSSRLLRRWTTSGGEAHHLIDPRTGHPADTDLVTVSVVADTASHAEILAKVALIEGSANGRRRLERAGVPALFTDDAGRRHHVGAIDDFLWSAA